jgi:hypothetical protein
MSSDMALGPIRCPGQGQFDERASGSNDLVRSKSQENQLHVYLSLVEYCTGYFLICIPVDFELDDGAILT